MFKSHFLLILLAMQSALPGQDVNDLMRKGDDALNAGLWEMAALHFDQCLTRKNTIASQKSEIAIRLAEAWVRDKKPAEALALLDQSFVSKHPAAPFWKGLALLELGRLADAVGCLSPLLENLESPFFAEAGFTIESIQVALGNPEAALETLAILARNPDPALGTKARLHRMEILLDCGRHKEAREALPQEAALKPADRPITAFLEAQLQLAEGHPEEAAAGFQTLVDQPEGQSSHRYHLAALGLADALRTAKKTDEAASFLLSFIQTHQESAYLEPLFGRLLECLPATPSITDSVLVRLVEWITPCETPFTGAIANVNASAAAVLPGVPTADSDLLVYAMFTRATGLLRIHSPEARAESIQLLTRLRLENPAHPLADRALFETARLFLNEGLTERALGILDTLRETAKLTGIRGSAAFVQASNAYARDDKKAALTLFEEAARNLSKNESKTAGLNAAIVALSGATGSTPVINKDHLEGGAITADLELERALSTSAPDARKNAIEDFITKHPDHPRLSEARLAAAEAALTGNRPDLPFARAQLDTLAASTENAGDLPTSRIAWLRLRIDDISDDPSAAIGNAREFLKQYPADSAAPDASFILGRNLFRTQNYNDARLVLEKLAASAPDSPRAQAAWLLAARSAALVPTSQSQQEALTLFDKVAKSKASVAPVAMLEKGRLLIDMNRLAEAAEFLRPWFDSLKQTDPLHLPVGLLLGEAIYAQGSANPTSLPDALAVYDKLLEHADKEPAVFNRIQYLRGRTLEQIPDEKDPARKREKQAFIAYYSVLETNGPPAEWHYFELCGFRALTLLENAGRWPAAIACAKKIASFKGPRAAEATTHANQLQLKHMIWED
ncbi:MAG: tetratricopeptide repeat protein [Verrucomicrobiota bacterium]